MLAPDHPLATRKRVRMAELAARGVHRLPRGRRPAAHRHGGRARGGLRGEDRLRDQRGRARPRAGLPRPGRHDRAGVRRRAPRPADRRRRPCTARRCRATSRSSGGAPGATRRRRARSSRWPAAAGPAPATPRRRTRVGRTPPRDAHAPQRPASAGGDPVRHDPARPAMRMLCADGAAWRCTLTNSRSTTRAGWTAARCSRCWLALSAVIGFAGHRDLGRDRPRLLLAGVGLARPRDPARRRSPRSAARPTRRPARPRALAVHGTVCGLIATLLRGHLGADRRRAPSGRRGRSLGLGRRAARPRRWSSALWSELPAQRERELAERVDVLTRTRRGALDVQAAELRRIERDLHDGAQARLVALSMQLGRAEERLGDRPRGRRAACAPARGEARRGDRRAARPGPRHRPAGARRPRPRRRRRGARPARARSPVDGRRRRSTRRPPPVVETAAYFVVAEALTNVAKHARRRRRAVDASSRTATARGRGRRRRARRCRRPRAAA